MLAKGEKDQGSEGGDGTAHQRPHDARSGGGPLGAGQTGAENHQGALRPIENLLDRTPGEQDPDRTAKKLAPPGASCGRRPRSKGAGGAGVTGPLPSSENIDRNHVSSFFRQNIHSLTKSLEGL